MSAETEQLVATVAGILGVLLAFSSMLLSIYVMTPKKKNKSK
jgi:hypothetical protein